MNKTNLLTKLLLLCLMVVGSVNSWGDPTSTSLIPASDLNPAQGVITAFSSSDANIDGNVYVARAGGTTYIRTVSGVAKANSIVFKLKNRAKVYFTLYNNNGSNKTTSAHFLSINENCYLASKLAGADARISTAVAGWSSETGTKKDVYDYLKDKYSSLKSADSNTDKVLLGFTVTTGISAAYGSEGNTGISVTSNKKDYKYFVFGDKNTYTTTEAAMAADAAVLDAGCYILEIYTTTDNVGITAITTEAVSSGHTISFKAGGGTGSMTSLTGIEDKGTQTLTSNTFTKTGYTFANWTADVDVTIGESTVEAGDPIADGATLTNITSDIALTAQWSAVDYAITHSAASNGSYTIQVGDAEAVTGNTTANYGQTITLDATPSSGYALKAWNVTKTSGGAAVAMATANTFLMPADAVTIDPEFDAIFTVSFNLQGHGDAIASQTIFDGGKVEEPTAPTADGWVFGGWYEEADCVNAWNFSTGTISSDKTLYAQWLLNNNATFSDGSYTIGETALDLSTLFAYGNGESVTYTVKDANGTGATIVGTSFTATTAGTATVTATQAATALMAGTVLDATITVSVNPQGSHNLEWTLNTNKSETSVGTKSKSSSSTSLPKAQMTNLTNNGDLTISNSTKSGYTVKIDTPVSYDEDKYMSVSFDVSSGYKFIPTAISITVQPVSTNKDVKLVLTDGVSSIEKTQNTLTAGSGTEVTLTNADSKVFSGTVTLKIYCYGADDDYRLGSTISIDGIVGQSATVTLAAACTDGKEYFGTYSNSKAFVVPSDLTVSAIKLNDSKKIQLMKYATGDIVAPNTGVLVSSTTSGAHDVIMTVDAGTTQDGNLLQPSGDSGVTAGDMADTDYYYYRLTMVNSKPGFWWKSDDGAGFALAANKAYLKILKTAVVEARGFNWLDDGETTGISRVDSSKMTVDGYYNLAGQRVGQPTKGLYIVNGKKVVIK